MRIGYACINNSVDCTTSSTFRLRSFSDDKLIQKVQQNLNCFMKILEWNLKNDIYFFRLGSGLVPFASHPICKFDWMEYFKKDFEKIGKFVKKNKMRISMHPDQFVVINSLNNKIVDKSVREIEYHCDILDLMKLGDDAKITIHVGGVYGDKLSSMKRFVENYNKLSSRIRKRLIIENDHISYSLRDCLWISDKTGVPVVFDTFHHECLNNSESLRECVLSSRKTWKKKDGPIILHYSSQKKNGILGSHAENIDILDFSRVIGEIGDGNFDLMLEIKDKEKSLLKIKKNLGL
jgi:UV DNA damage endonuclease